MYPRMDWRCFLFALLYHTSLTARNILPSREGQVRAGPGESAHFVCLFTPRAEGSGVDSDILSCLESFSPNVAIFEAVVSVLADAVLIFSINTASSVSFQ